MARPRLNQFSNVRPCLTRNWVHKSFRAGPSRTADFAKRFKPIFDEYQKLGIRYALEVHPTEIAFDIASAQRALEAQACDRMMPDLMKIGGITGWLSVMGLARAASMPVSSHLFIEASAHVLAVTPTCDWLEFMDFGSPVLQTPSQLVQGGVVAQGPGLGIVWDEAAVARYLVS